MLYLRTSGDTWIISNGGEMSSVLYLHTILETHFENQRRAPDRTFPRDDVRIILVRSKKLVQELPLDVLLLGGLITKTLRGSI
jgi:hypothetical protein